MKQSMADGQKHSWRCRRLAGYLFFGAAFVWLLHAAFTDGNIAIKIAMATMFMNIGLLFLVSDKRAENSSKEDP